MTVFTDAAAKLQDEYRIGPPDSDDSPEYKDLVIRQMYKWWPNLFQLLDELMELPAPTNGDAGTQEEADLHAWRDADDQADDPIQYGATAVEFEKTKLPQRKRQSTESSQTTDQIVPAERDASARDDETQQIPAVREDDLDMGTS